MDYEDKNPCLNKLLSTGPENLEKSGNLPKSQESQGTGNNVT